jgi:DNA-directed RNA polymerase subunit RPC12/RpoP
MTNWQPKETTVFICPDCEHEQQEMTETCPACGNRRLPRKTSRHRLYQIVFHMNLGNRKEKYRILLTEAQFRMLTELDEQDAYELIQSKFWDRVVDMYTDHGCDFDAMTFNAECLKEGS